jgi:hypothetical protein
MILPIPLEVLFNITNGLTPVLVRANSTGLLEYHLLGLCVNSFDRLMNALGL